MTIKSLTNLLSGRIKLYWSLIKSLQTGLLLLTGLVGFVCTGQSLTDWPPLVGLAGSLFLRFGNGLVSALLRLSQAAALRQVSPPSWPGLRP